MQDSTFTQSFGTFGKDTGILHERLRVDILHLIGQSLQQIAESCIRTMIGKNTALFPVDSLPAQGNHLIQHILISGVLNVIQVHMGNHARIQIVDEAKRKELFGLGDAEVSTPILLNEESVKELLAIRSKAKFNEQLEAMVKTDAEKRMLVELAFSVGAEDAESWKVDALRKLAETAKV